MVRRLVRSGVLFAALALAGCTAEFGGDSGAKIIRDPSQVMQEYERRERDRQLFQNTPASER